MDVSRCPGTLSCCNADECPHDAAAATSRWRMLWDAPSTYEDGISMLLLGPEPSGAWCHLCGGADWRCGEIAAPCCELSGTGVTDQVHARPDSVNTFRNPLFPSVTSSVAGLGDTCGAASGKSLAALTLIAASREQD